MCGAGIRPVPSLGPMVFCSQADVIIRPPQGGCSSPAVASPLVKPASHGTPTGSEPRNKTPHLARWCVGFCACRSLQAQKMCPQAYFLLGRSHNKIQLAPPKPLLPRGMAKNQASLRPPGIFLAAGFDSSCRQASRTKGRESGSERR